MQHTSLLSRLSAPPPDPIFAAADRAKKAGPNVLNATIGVVLNEEGVLELFPSIQKAIQTLHMEQTAYPPLAGLPAYQSTVRTLVFGDKEPHVAVTAVAGGTGALSALLRVAHTAGYRNVLLPVPTWANHARVVTGMGFELHTCPYLAEGIPSFTPLIEQLGAAKEPQLLLVQSGCHNPTGLDPSEEEWRALGTALAGTAHTVLLDMAYQGLGNGVAEDTLPVSLLIDAGTTPLVAWSASKNHCLYGLRAGAALAYTKSEEEKQILEKHLVIATRSLYSVAPVTGQQIVAITQLEFAKEWEHDLTELRTLLRQKREALAIALPAYSKTILRCRGLFVQLPLGTEQVAHLTKQNTFLTPDGRINIAGIALRDIPLLGSHIAECIK